MSLSLEERVASLERALRASNEQLRNLGAVVAAMQSPTTTVRRPRRTREPPVHKAYAKILFDGGSLLLPPLPTRSRLPTRNRLPTRSSFRSRPGRRMRSTMSSGCNTLRSWRRRRSRRKKRRKREGGGNWRNRFRMPRSCHSTQLGVRADFHDKLGGGGTCLSLEKKIRNA